jgi:hypothetical protein
MRHINRWAADRIGTEFGLVVGVTDLSRGLIEDEKVSLEKVQLVLREEWEADQAEIRGETAIRAKQRAQESASLDSAGQDLKNIEARLLGTGLDEDEREELTARAAALRAQVKGANKDEQGRDGYERVLRRAGLDERPGRRSLSAGSPNVLSLRAGSDSKPEGE